MKDKLTMLMILDGFGDNKNKDGNAIKLANTPNIDKLMKKYNLTLKQVHGHYEFANKACPSFKIEKFRQEFNEWKAKQNSKTILLTNEKKKGILPKICNFLFDIFKSYFKK